MPNARLQRTRDAYGPQPLALRVLRRFAEGQTAMEIANAEQTSASLVRRLLAMRDHMTANVIEGEQH